MNPSSWIGLIGATSGLGLGLIGFLFNKKKVGSETELILSQASGEVIGHLRKEIERLDNSLQRQIQLCEQEKEAIMVQNDLLIKQNAELKLHHKQEKGLLIKLLVEAGGTVRDSDLEQLNNFEDKA